MTQTPIGVILMAGNSLQPHGQGLVQDNEAINIVNQDEVTAAATTCEICTEPFSPGKVFYNGDRCVHPFCLKCIAKYLEYRILDNSIGNIPCPAWKCVQSLDPIVCRRIISKDLFVKWCDALCTSALPEVQYRCCCPYEGCSALIINECKGDESVRKVQCPNCKRDLCFKCQVPWHEGKMCGKSDRNRFNDAKFAQLVRRKRWRTCPKCGRCVERVSGCAAIRCRCGALFCYECGEDRGSASTNCHHVILHRSQVCFCICCILILIIFGVTAVAVV